MEETKIKFIGNTMSYVDNEDISEDERNFEQSIYECCSCHWRFTGDVVRYGYGYDLEGQDTPDYCPMCGKKITDLEE